MNTNEEPLLEDMVTETPATKSETLPTRQTKRSSTFMHMDVMNCCDEVDDYADQYQDPNNFICAVILELEKMTK